MCRYAVEVTFVCIVIAYMARDFTFYCFIFIPTKKKKMMEIRWSGLKILDISVVHLVKILK